MTDEERQRYKALLTRTEEEIIAVTVRVYRNGQITIPKVIRDQVGISQGDLLNVKLRDDNIIVLEIRKSMAGEDESWFRSEEWQENEKLADEDIKAGRISPIFESADDAIKALKSNQL